eukprot:6070659-Alexandrium_andersonii.AAC.1
MPLGVASACVHCTQFVLSVSRVVLPWALAVCVNSYHIRIGFAIPRCTLPSLDAAWRCASLRTLCWTGRACRGGHGEA